MAAVVGVHRRRERRRQDQAGNDQVFERAAFGARIVVQVLGQRDDEEQLHQLARLQRKAAYGDPALRAADVATENEHQQELFGDPDNRTQLSATMDKLNLKYGHTTLHFGSMLPARESAPTRIAFTQIPVQYGADYL